MKLEKQVCTFEQGIKLKKFDIMQVSQFHHFCTGFHSDGNGNYPPKYILAHHNNAPDGYVGNEGCSAFTTAELLLMNGETITINNQQLPISAEAIADHLLWRLERDEVTAEECNYRLI